MNPPRCPERIAKQISHYAYPGQCAAIMRPCQLPLEHLAIILWVFPPPTGLPGPIFAPFSATDQGLTFPDIVFHLTLGMVQNLSVYSSLFSTQGRGCLLGPTAGGRCTQAHTFGSGATLDLGS